MELNSSINDPATKVDTGAQPAAALEDELAQATEEFFSRIDAGQEPDIEAFAAEYPELQSVLLSVLPALCLMQSSIGGRNSPSGNTSDPRTTGLLGSEAGVRLGDYELLREIGRGGMGVVYEAKQVSLERRVALKVLPFAATLDSRRIQRFRNESQAVASLDHSSIVEVYSVGCEAGVHFYAMRFVDGQSLADIIAQLRFGKRNATKSQPTQTSDNLRFGNATNRDTRADVAESTDRSHRILASYGSHDSTGIRNAARLIYEIALALDHAHQQGIVHRDVKPGNILVDLDGKPWIADFGLAQVASSESLTLTGDLLGTLRYMAPEQLDASPTDHRIDIYALGASFYELLTLEPLVGGDDRESLMRCVRDGTQTPPSRLTSKIPRDLETIVMKAIERDPQSRYATAAALAADLQAWLDGRSISARRASSAERCWRWCRRNPLVSGLLAAIVLLSATVSVISIKSNQVLTEQNEKLKAISQKEKLQYTNAQERFEIALQAIRTFHSNVSSDLMLEQEEFTELKRKLLGAALAFYRDLSHQLGDSADPQSLNSLARVYIEIGDISADIGSIDDTIEAQENAVALFRQLIASPSGVNDISTATILADTLNDLGFHRSQVGSDDAASEKYLEALQLYETYSPEAKDRIANTLTNLANLSRWVGNTEDSKSYYDRAIQASRSADLSKAKYREGLATALNDCANFYSSLGESDKAARLLDEAISMMESLCEEFPDDFAYAGSLSNSYGNRGNQFWSQGRRTEALAEYEKSVPIQRRLVLERPGDSEARGQLARLLGNFGSMHFMNRDNNQAIDLLEESVAQFETLIEYDSHVHFHEYLASYLQTLGDAYLNQGMTTLAEERVRRAIDVKSKLLAENPGTTAYANGIAAAQISLGDLLMNTDRTAEAIQLLTSSKDEFAKQLHGVALPPDFLQTQGYLLVALARASLLTEDSDAAARYSKEAIALLDLEEATHRAGIGYAHFFLGRATDDRQEFLEAARILQLDQPDSPDSFCALSLAYAGSLEVALAMVDAIDIAQTSSAELSTAAETYYFASEASDEASRGDLLQRAEQLLQAIHERGYFTDARLQRVSRKRIPVDTFWQSIEGY